MKDQSFDKLIPHYKKQTQKWLKRSYFILVFLLLFSWPFYINAFYSWPKVLSNLFISFTMMLGSFIAGASSEGGGAVAFPVMTLIYKIQPSVARDFSLMVQSFGMLSAALCILVFNISVLGKVIIISSAGGLIGMILGLELLIGVIPAVYVKLLFTSLWASFALVIVMSKMLGEAQDRLIFTPSSVFLLFFTGLMGGLISSLTGSGIDILVFSLLILYFRVNLKIATPTSVILMGINSVVGFFYKSHFIVGGMSGEAREYLLNCIPIVIIGAPLGTLFITKRTKEFVAKFLVISLIIQYLASLVILPMNKTLFLFSFIVLTGGLLLFYSLNRIGEKYRANSF